jgi:uridine kinase
MKATRKATLAQLFALSVMVLTPLAANAQTNSEAEQIRDELRRMKQDYQQRMEQLEQRLRRLEASPATVTVTNAPEAKSAFGTRPTSPPLEPTQS